MYIIKKIDQYHENYIYFCEPIKNNIITEGIFTRILYSNNNIIFNGIYLEIPLIDVYFEKYYNKYKCCFNMNIHENKEVIDRIRHIEETILQKYDTSNKIPHYKIFEHIRNGNIKIFCDIVPKNTTILVLKISGIWETQSSYGLTYKFINFTHSVL
jgi:hypothetical protein